MSNTCASAAAKKTLRSLLCRQTRRADNSARHRRIDRTVAPADWPLTETQQPAEWSHDQTWGTGTHPTPPEVTGSVRREGGVIVMTSTVVLVSVSPNRPVDVTEGVAGTGIGTFVRSDVPFGDPRIAASSDWMRAWCCWICATSIWSSCCCWGAIPTVVVPGKASTPIDSPSAATLTGGEDSTRSAVASISKTSLRCSRPSGPSSR